jgi:hypothetical protein
MIPSVDDRLASVVRALTDVVMPSLPPEAGLAKEQIQLAVGHLMILRAQIDGTPGFETDEAEDARVLGQILLAKGDGGTATKAALAALKAVVDTSTGVRTDRINIHTAIDGLVKATSVDGSASFRAALGNIIVKHQTPRTMKDRHWFSPFGFDSL